MFDAVEKKNILFIDAIILLELKKGVIITEPRKWKALFMFDTFNSLGSEPSTFIFSVQ